MFAYTVYVLYDVCFIVNVGFKSSLDLVFVYVYHAPTLNKALLLYIIIIIVLLLSIGIQILEISICQKNSHVA